MNALLVWIKKVQRDFGVKKFCHMETYDVQLYELLMTINVKVINILFDQVMRYSYLD